MLALSSFKSLIVEGEEELDVFFVTKKSGAVDSHLHFKDPSPENAGVET